MFYVKLFLWKHIPLNRATVKQEFYSTVEWLAIFWYVVGWVWHGFSLQPDDNFKYSCIVKVKFTKHLFGWFNILYNFFIRKFKMEILLYSIQNITLYLIRYEKEMNCAHKTRFILCIYITLFSTLLL